MSRLGTPPEMRMISNVKQSEPCKCVQTDVFGSNGEVGSSKIVPELMKGVRWSLSSVTSVSHMD